MINFGSTMSGVPPQSEEAVRTLPQQPQAPARSIPPQPGFDTGGGVMSGAAPQILTVSRLSGEERVRITTQHWVQPNVLMQLLGALNSMQLNKVHGVRQLARGVNHVIIAGRLTAHGFVPFKEHVTYLDVWNIEIADAIQHFLYTVNNAVSNNEGLRNASTSANEVPSSYLIRTAAERINKLLADDNNYITGRLVNERLAGGQ